jgi:hypothetical protein
LRERGAEEVTEHEIEHVEDELTPDPSTVKRAAKGAAAAAALGAAAAVARGIAARSGANGGTES